MVADRFPAVLRQRLDQYFTDRNLSPKANGLMTLKIVLGLLLWAGTYLSLYVFHLDSWAFFAIYILHGLGHTFLVLNVAHDSNHNAISNKFAVNRALSYVFDLCGVNSYMWRILHHRGHHSCVNIHGEDEAISGRRMIFRFSAHAPRVWVHRFQHVYALAFYAFFSLDYVFFKDFEYYFIPEVKTLRREHHPAHELLLLFGGKLFYYTYMLILPVVVLGRTPALVGLSFLAAHLVAGLCMVIVFQTSHALDESAFPTRRHEYGHYIYHILATTADYGTESPLTTFLVGGLNHHVAHHLCPQASHTHYPKLTRIIRQTAREYGVTYREHQSIWEALGHHMKLLRQLGREAEGTV
jgi:linoleoyl-CoA desaturase